MSVTVGMFDSNGDGYLPWTDVEKAVRVLGVAQARALKTGFFEVDGTGVLTDQVREGVCVGKRAEGAIRRCFTLTERAT